MTPINVYFFICMCIHRIIKLYTSSHPIIPAMGCLDGIISNQSLPLFYISSIAKKRVKILHPSHSVMLSALDFSCLSLLHLSETTLWRITFSHTLSLNKTRTYAKCEEEKNNYLWRWFVHEVKS